MKAKDIDIEIMNIEKQDLEIITYKNIKVQTAISKITKTYPDYIITDVKANYFN